MQKRYNVNIEGSFGYIKWIVIIGVIALLAFNSFFTINEQEAAVVTTFGIASPVTESGLHFKIPFVQQVTKVDTTIKGFPIGYDAQTNNSVEDAYSPGRCAVRSVQMASALRPAASMRTWFSPLPRVTDGQTAVIVSSGDTVPMFWPFTASDTSPTVENAITMTDEFVVETMFSPTRCNKGSSLLQFAR